MIKHLGESLTPFETLGFSRVPEMPLVGEAVTVTCRADGEVPALALEAGEQRRNPPARALGDGRFSFDLGSFETAQTVRYRIFTSNESTSWFSFDVLTVRELGTPTALYTDGQTVLAAFLGGLTLSFEGGACLLISLALGTASGTPCESAVLPLPEGFSLEIVKSEKIWELKRFSKQVCRGDGLLLYTRADGSPAKVHTRVYMPCKQVLGTGERFDAVNQKGRGTNGRVVEKFTCQGEQSYLPVPFFLTEQGLGWYRESDIPARMRFDDGMTITQETEGDLLTRDILFFGEPAQVLKAFVDRTGTPVLPPEWSFGVWISANGWKNDAEVAAQLAALKAYDYPASVMVLEAWSDERTFAQWNGDGSWKDPAALVARLRREGLHLVLWQIPVVKYEWGGEPGETLKNDAREAIAKGYAVKSADGSPYRITDNWFHHSLLLDFTNPEAVRWWFSKRKHLLDMGVEGFKTDGGEFLYEKGARLYSGLSGLRAHNLYPTQYIGAYHDFFRQNGVEGVTFSRAGCAGAQTQPIHWAGDQLSTWAEFQSQLYAGISAGLSGVLFWGFDIGGFAGELPSAELYLRATAMGCFSPVMQWHAEPRSGQFYGTYVKDFNNDRSPWNLSEKLGDSRILTIGCQYARLREQLRPYLFEEAKHCVAARRPMMAHLCLDFPKDPRAFAETEAYMLGRRYLVAPIVREGQTGRTVYLPKGRWRHFFTGEWFAGGREIQVDCPLEQIPVFERGSGLDEG